MIGLMIIAVVFVYIVLAKFIIKKVYKKYKTKKSKYIVTAIMILIPTWDVILGFPIYAYLCMFESGTKIYKTVDNVEGFYVGKKSISSEPIKPYEGYKYIDYKEKKGEKYYRSYWIDSNISIECIKPKYPDSPYDEYTKAFKSGKCIVKKEIAENEVNRWELEQYHTGTTEYIVPILDINKFYEMQISDRYIRKYIGQVINYSWKVGWVYGFLSSIETGSSNYITCFKFHLNNEKTFLQITLKPKNGEK